ncbi:alpha/beta fold hydrolase [Kitasatospora xanthocidica]|uniref:Alpha/beta fold hydrolase n=1 Tax=Kitasatospora xanthocidica TaxID=83382 RepID=A0A373A3U8_9ACTN|nr:alpha/beta fold hydrolase [Kitasatospora xanthocidica]RGD62332.1 alpha/beta fold hydrolase [Kitasatospora xanthocidica]
MIISHDVAGSGPAVVLLHSSVCDRRMWDAQWQPLVDAGHRVVRCDFRGFGDTPLADAPYSDAGDVLALLDHLGIGTAALVGASYGGRIALTAAALRPEAVTRLALLGAGMPGHQPSDTLRAFGGREDALIEAGRIDEAVELNVESWLGPEADERTRAHVRRMQRHAFDVQMTATVGSDREDVDLGRITAPTLAVSGAHDFPDFREIAAALPALLPDARHQELPWAGHLPSLERPAETTALLLAFLHEDGRAAR